MGHPVAPGDAKSFLLFQQIARVNSPRGDDVCPLSALAVASRRFSVERGIDICHMTVRFAVLTASPTNSGRIPSPTALNIAPAGNPNYCLLTNRGPSEEYWSKIIVALLNKPLVHLAVIRKLGDVQFWGVSM
jgi:hypothetical protein